MINVNLADTYAEEWVGNSAPINAETADKLLGYHLKRSLVDSLLVSYVGHFLNIAYYFTKDRVFARRLIRDYLVSLHSNECSHDYIESPKNWLRQSFYEYFVSCIQGESAQRYTSEDQRKRCLARARLYMSLYD